MSGLIPSDALFVRTHFERAAELSQDSGCFVNNHIQPIFHGIAATFASAADVILYPVTALPRAFCELVTEGVPEAIGSLYHDLIATCQTFMLAVIGVITVAISVFFPGIYNMLFAPETAPSGSVEPKTPPPSPPVIEIVPDASVSEIDIHQAFNDKDEELVLSYINGGGDLSVKLNVESDAGFSTTLLASAVACGWPKVVEALIKKGVDVNAVGLVSGDYSLQLAAALGEEEIVTLLLDAKADPNASSEVNMRPPLAQAAYKGHLGIAKKLVDAGADTGYTYYEQIMGHSFERNLIDAACQGRGDKVAMVAFLRDIGVSVHSLKRRIFGDQGLMKFYIEQRYSLEGVKSLFGDSPLKYARDNGWDDVVRLLDPPETLDSSVVKGRAKPSGRRAPSRGHRAISRAPASERKS